MAQPFDATLEIEHVVAGGDGLARHEGLVVFVPRTLGGERVSARVSIKGKLGRGRLVGIERPSPARVAPECPHYEGDACGGCQLQHASYAAQLAAKAHIVVQTFRRIAKLDVDLPDVLPAASPWRYRRKLTLTLRRQGSRWYAGLRRYDDPDAVFELNECLITAEPVLDVWRSVMRASGHLPVAQELRGAVRVDLDGRTSFVLEGGDAWPRANAFFDAAPALGSLWWVPSERRRQRMALRESAEATPDASFAQVNEATSASLAAHVLDRARAHAPAHVVDAYAGTGTTTRVLDESGVRVTAIELDQDAANWAARSLSSQSRVVNDRVERVLDQLLPADVVIMNPPRTGVDPRVCEVVVRSNPSPRAVIYVSCDPATLARDVARLPGWRIASMKCFDMFPQTAHVETVCELVPAA